MPDPKDPNDPNNPPPPPESGGSPYAGNEKIANINVADEIKNSFLDYSMSVIISRALPDARDGLKPSQRRILFAMHDLSLFPNRQHRKCAKICGDTSGNYRSEEHTSELQSQSNLVCRLLLEKKKLA